MEVFLPILIAVVVFGFQIYRNFRKEQKKAGERAVKQKETLQNKKVNIPSFEQYSRLAPTIEEAKQTKTLVKPRLQAPERLAPFQAGEDASKPYDASDFNLRDAVIQSAILHRPYA